ncbi:hypothetical protein CDIK_1992, partial [Cucumispora dikerogammari]
KGSLKKPMVPIFSRSLRVKVQFLLLIRVLSHHSLLVLGQNRLFADYYHPYIQYYSLESGGARRKEFCLWRNVLPGYSCTQPCSDVLTTACQRHFHWPLFQKCAFEDTLLMSN